MQRLELDRLLATLNVWLEAVAVCQVARGFSLRFNPSESVVLHHVVRGVGVLKVDGSAPIALGPDAMLLIPPRRAKSIYVGEAPTTAVSATDCCSVAANGLLRLDGTDGCASDLVIVCCALRAKLGSFSPFDDLCAPISEDMSNDGAVRLAFQTMLAEQINPRLGGSGICAALMKQCLLLFIRRLFQTKSVSSLSLTLSDERLARALNSILKHPGELCIKDLAASVGMSRSAFAKRFMEALHTTPMGFARRTRLHRAAELLTSTDLPIKTIAGEAGYASRSQFCRAFRVAFKAHPSHYRKSQLHSRTPGLLIESGESASLSAYPPEHHHVHSAGISDA